MLHLLADLAAYADPLSKIGAGLAVLYGGWLWLVRLYAKQARAMSGEWTNEGDVSAPPRTHNVSMTTEVKGQHVTGTVQAWFGEGHSPLASIVGKRYGPFIKADILHVRHGKVLECGKLRLRYREGVMQFRCKPLANFYPEHSELWRVERRDTPR